MKSKDTLISFIKYCVENPNQRFWQALKNWSRFSFILGSNDVFEKWNTYKGHLKNTFYFEGKYR